MSNIDKRALRKKLNRRLNDAFGFQRTSGGKHTTISLSIDECKSVLVALDELEAAEKQLASWRSLAKKNIEEHEKAVAALDTARHRICELESKLTQNESWSMAAQKYIAELEEREVKLPEPEQWSICQVLLDKVKVSQAIRAAGIRINGRANP